MIARLVGRERKARERECMVLSDHRATSVWVVREQLTFMAAGAIIYAS